MFVIFYKCNFYRFKTTHLKKFFCGSYLPLYIVDVSYNNPIYGVELTRFPSHVKVIIKEEGIKGLGSYKGPKLSLTTKPIDHLLLFILVLVYTLSPS